MEAVLMARAYNHMTGASITHIEMEEWGFMEIAEVEYAIRFAGKL